MATAIDAAADAHGLTARGWRELSLALRDRGHGWRTPVLATVDPEQQPQARTVVLRGVDAEKSQLRVFTDARSPKVAELRARPRAVLVFWSAALNWPLRATVDVTVLDEGTEVDAAWARVSPSAAARDYLTPVAPGQVLQGSAGGTADQHHLAILLAQVQALDWLELGGQGEEHRRCRITPEGVERLVP
ncbi:MAG: pyridoxamine 5'-phosphate oxidase family protein [Hydrogenophaga sp.]